MPRGDGTGPDGKGPRTGRGLGKASGNPQGSGVGKPRGGSGSSKSNQMPDRGTGRGRNRD